MKNPAPLTPTQEKAQNRIDRIVSAMYKCWNNDDLLALYCKADDIRWQYFPKDAAEEGDSWYVTKIYNNLRHKNEEEGHVYVTLFGKTVKMACA